MKLILACIVALAVGVIPASAENGGLPDNLPKVQAALVPERMGVAPGATVTIALKEVIRKNWHTYWRNPGDAGAPTTIIWHLPPGWRAGPVQWPYPKRLPVDQLMDFGYEGQVALLSDLTAPHDAPPGGTANISADVNWLVCSDVCIPESTHLSLNLPVTAHEPPADASAASLFAATRAHLPQKSPWSARYDAADKRFALLIEHPLVAQELPREAVFYPYDDGIVEAAAPQRLEMNDSGLVLESLPGNKLASAEKRQTVRGISGLLVLTSASGVTSSYELQAEPGPVGAATPAAVASGGLSLAFALLSAVLGGFILNLMPCVFPVLSMKALALAAKPEHLHETRRSGLAYGGGVVLSFVLLAGVLLGLRSAGAALGWGFQLQQPVFVAALALLMFVIGLNLSGAYDIRIAASAGGALASRRGGASGSFFTGVLAVLVAAPCTAPFMGAATGYALSADTASALAIFAALGAGFAAPFVALAFAPALLRRIPRPGPWMLLLRRVLAFPMYGAAVWLAWVLSLQAGPQGVLELLAAALLLAFALWLADEEMMERQVWFRRAAAGLAIVGAIFAVAGISNAPASENNRTPGQLAYEPFSAARLAALQQSGRPVFVNVTAAWCITCLVNERFALSGPDVAKVFADHQVAALKADWTNQDSSITDLLASHSRSGVPLYLYYPPRAATPVLLPQLLTAATVIAAVNKKS
jgi:thiol:disulfide interchange protein